MGDLQIVIAALFVSAAGLDTDPAAATAIMRRVGAPRRMGNVLEGEEWRLEV